MNIYTLCIDPERGRYLAISTTDHRIKAFSYTSEDEALGRLVFLNPGIQIDEVFSIDKSEPPVKTEDVEHHAV